ncbi:hypothetical protein H9P43_003398 [Blastocladiella emersonii ATCC 22665]|nr:hypothetical protein H9P43_003398 [Blastocladiella emersonii ATCC 22665]
MAPIGHKRAASGTHAELVARKGFYYELVRNQQVEGGDKKEDVEEEEDEDAAEVKLERAASVKSTGSLAHTSAVPKTIYDEVSDEKWPFVRAMRLNFDMWPWTLLGLAAAIVAGAITPSYALVYARAITDYGNAYSYVNGALVPKVAELERLGSQWGVVFLVIAIIAGVSNYLQTLAFTVSGESIVMKMRDMCFGAMVAQEGGFYDRKENSVGSLAGKLAVESSLVRKLVGDTLGTITQVSMSLLIGAILSLYYCWQLSLVVIACAPMIIVSGMYQSRAQKGLAGMKADNEASSLSSEAVSNVRTIASLGLEKRFLAEYDHLLEEPTRHARVGSLLGGAAFGFSNAANWIVYAVAFTYASRLIGWGIYSFQDVFQAITTVMFSSMMGGRIATFLPDYNKARTAAIEVFRLIDRKPSIDISRQAESIPKLENVRGEITFEDVHFRYPSRPKVRVHRGLSFKIPAGSRVALVGSSGCGKSTVIQQLERFYDPARGRILIDGVDIASVDLHSLRSTLSLVGQEPILFDGTVMDNIKYGAVDPSKVTDEEVYEAARQADVHDFISNLSQGYQTPVGERGGMLSGGQKQRVAIARALIRKPKILLLDECTAALDSASEAAVQQALEAASRGRTTISIAHRLSSIVNSDILFALDKGRLVEQGTHTELVAKRGFYFKLVEAQMDSAH